MNKIIISYINYGTVLDLFACKQFKITRKGYFFFLGNRRQMYGNVIGQTAPANTTMTK